MQEVQIWARHEEGNSTCLSRTEEESPERTVELLEASGYTEIVAEGICQDCCQFGELEFVEGFRLCSVHCASHTGQDPKELRRLQRALEREAGEFARQHSYLIDPTYRAE